MEDLMSSKGFSASSFINWSKVNLLQCKAAFCNLNCVVSLADGTRCLCSVSIREKGLLSAVIKASSVVFNDFLIAFTLIYGTITFCNMLIRCCTKYSYSLYQKIHWNLNFFFHLCWIAVHVALALCNEQCHTESTVKIWYFVFEIIYAVLQTDSSWKHWTVSYWTLMTDSQRMLSRRKQHRHKWIMP